MSLPASAPLIASVPHIVASGIPVTHSIPWLPADASWLSISQGCVPIAIAAIVAWVGWRQLATASARLKLDLFEKRLAIFDLTWEALSKASEGRFIEPDEMGPLHNAIPEAAFLFGRDIENYIRMVKTRLADYQLSLLQALQENEYASEELKEKCASTQAWFKNETGAVQVKFKPYLSFERWR